MASACRFQRRKEMIQIMETVDRVFKTHDRKANDEQARLLVQYLRGL
jgi:hypothetical protein